MNKLQSIFIAGYETLNRLSARALQSSPAMALITTPTADRILASAIRVHCDLGPGRFESVYENCLAHLLAKEGLAFTRQAAVVLEYEGLVLPCAFRADLIVAAEVLVEIKAAERILPVHHFFPKGLCHPCLP